MAVVHAADSWISDLLYAREHGEEVPRDRHFDWCRQFCEFFTRCRGAESLGAAVVTDPEMVAAAAFLAEGREQSKLGGLLEKAAKTTLAPLQQSVGGDLRAFELGDYRLRWVWQNREGAGHWKALIDRIEAT